MSATPQPNDTLNALRAGKLSGIKRLDLSCGLTTFPTEVFALADSLEILNLSGNQLSSLPDDLTRLKKLKIIFCSDNQFVHLPEVLGEFEHLNMVGFKANKIRHCPASAISHKLRWLILTDNALEKIPENIGDCQHMQKLMLAGNQLSALPESLLRCQNIELLRISANQFAHFPDWLLSLPRLAWLAYAGNPFTHAQETSILDHAPLPLVDWAALKIGKKLGEGASGLIFEASFADQKNHNAHFSESVAVKLFKGSVTSDGLPESEMAAWIHAGDHPHLASVCGKLTHHPEKKQGLVMPMLDADFKVLAGPPSLDSCTRDTYADNLTFSPQAMLNIAANIAHATAHLHVRGLLHGDLYAHNILLNRQQHALLSDFGGAAFLPENKPLAQKLQKIEVRAFGILLEELISRGAVGAEESQAMPQLQQLQKACDAQTIEDRPLMQEVFAQLKRLQSNIPQ